jgi:hypothetical protein
LIKVSIYEQYSIYVEKRMGLDQYAYAQKSDERTKICQWRKHSNLQGWMQNLYESRGGKESFNCIDLKLEEEDLLKLKAEHNTLEAASGFFWGESTTEDIAETEEFIGIALEYLNRGYTIVYSSWW